GRGGRRTSAAGPAGRPVRTPRRWRRAPSARSRRSPARPCARAGRTASRWALLSFRARERHLEQTARVGIGAGRQAAPNPLDGARGRMERDQRPEVRAHAAARVLALGHVGEEHAGELRRRPLLDLLDATQAEADERALEYRLIEEIVG